MNSIFDLWKKRILYFLGLYYQFIVFQFDAVIFGYTVAFIGILAFVYTPVIRQYIALLAQEPWFTLLQLVTLGVMLKGNIKGYLKGADEVFLSPMNISAKTFVGYSEKLSILLNIFGWGVYIAILYGINQLLHIGTIEYYFYLFIMGLLLHSGSK